jgi:hypothetical protein
MVRILVSFKLFQSFNSLGQHSLDFSSDNIVATLKKYVGNVLNSLSIFQTNFNIDAAVNEM